MDERRLNLPVKKSRLDSVIIRNLTYEVGSGRNKKLILNQINLTVPEASIYGLLGPSGCGKTTMLRCVVGRIKTDPDSVLVFGCRPGDSHSEVPGRNVGYMPQEISIYEDFTIQETLQYFGKINRMRGIEIEQRIDFLLQFLDLPSRNRLVTHLSGGQKRRVSLAAALVHSPPLMILDEPTVGVDPLLRQSIWHHLVSLTQSEKITVMITTHYIEEARQANVVGLMRNGKILAENSPDELMRLNNLMNLEDVFLKLCVTDSSRRTATLPNSNHFLNGDSHLQDTVQDTDKSETTIESKKSGHTKITHISSSKDLRNSKNRMSDHSSPHVTSVTFEAPNNKSREDRSEIYNYPKPIIIGRDNQSARIYHLKDSNDSKESLTSKQSHELVFESDDSSVSQLPVSRLTNGKNRQILESEQSKKSKVVRLVDTAVQSDYLTSLDLSESSDNYIYDQAMGWAARRSRTANYLNMRVNSHQNNYQRNGVNSNKNKGQVQTERNLNQSKTFQWWKILMAVTWKNYIRLRRNPPVLVFQFLLPAIQVILFCFCIGGEPFDVPVAVVNDEVIPKSSLQFLSGLNKNVIRQIGYDNMTSALDAVRRGEVWGVIHIPDKYSQHLQARLIMGEEVNEETIANGTIRVYPDLTNLHLALALQTTFRETFMNFAKNSLEDLGYSRSLADMPIQIAKPVYGTLNKHSYLEFMAPGVVISISYVMATGLTALAFILERRDGLLERSLISGVQTSQILLAHAINQVVVMALQICLVLGCTFFVFEIPSRGSFFWVVLLVLLQGCTGMSFGLLVSALCSEENTAVMMVVGTFYTNLILAGIIWPIEAMPRWLRPISYAQPQTLSTESLRHILSRGWGITEPGVLLGFAVTIGWLVIFLISAGLVFKYMR